MIKEWIVGWIKEYVLLTLLGLKRRNGQDLDKQNQQMSPNKVKEVKLEILKKKLGPHKLQVLPSSSIIKNPLHQKSHKNVNGDHHNDDDDDGSGDGDGGGSGYKKQYQASAGIIWMYGQNNPVGDPDDPEASLPYLYEQANVLNTLLKNMDDL